MNPAQEIEARVQVAVDAIGDGRFRAITCGSYRRGKKDCGDVDVLITADREYTQGSI